MSRGAVRKFEWFLLVPFFSLFFFSLLYVFRVYDNNTLTSWQWTFVPLGIAGILLILAAAVVLSFAVAWYLSFEKFPKSILVGLSILAVVPLWVEPELLLDSGRYFLQAKSLARYGAGYFVREWGSAITVWTDMPLVPFLYGVIFNVAGESRTAIQLFNTGLFVLTILMTCRIGTILWNRETGFFAGLLLLGMPYLLTQVPLMLVDVPTMFFLVLALSSFLTALRAGGFLRLLLAGLTIAAAVISKYSTWPMLALFPVCGFVYLQNSPEARHGLRRTATVLLIAALPLLGLCIYKYPVFRQQLELLLSYQRPALQLWHENSVSTFFFQIHPFLSLLAGYGAWKAYRARDSRFIIPLLFVLLIVILQIRRIRYMLPLFPFLALVAACGLGSLKNIPVQRYISLSIVSWSLVVLFAAYLPFFKTTGMTNIQAAGAFLNRLDTETVEVYTLPQEKSGGSTVIALPQLDLFTDTKLVSRQEWSPDPSRHLPPLSPLLATWKLNKPLFYADDRPSGPLVIISASPVDASVYRQIRGSFPTGREMHFSRQSGVFRYKTFVSIYY